MRIYVAGPMSGIPKDNVPAFEQAGEWLVSQGIEALLPHTIEPYSHLGVPCRPGPRGESEHTGPCHLRADIIEMLTCDGIALLQGWEASAGARLEMSVAAQCGLDINVVRYGWSGPYFNSPFIIGLYKISSDPES